MLGCGALFETDILIARKHIAKHMTYTTTTNLRLKILWQHGLYFSPRCSMRTISGVLKSPWAALLIERIVGLIGRLLPIDSGQKGGQITAVSGLQIQPTARFSSDGQIWPNKQYDHQSKLSSSWIDWYHYWRNNNINIALPAASQKKRLLEQRQHVTIRCNKIQKHIKSCDNVLAHPSRTLRWRRL